jgi:hypothetical protein
MTVSSVWWCAWIPMIKAEMKEKKAAMSADVQMYGGLLVDAVDDADEDFVEMRNCCWLKGGGDFGLALKQVSVGLG